VARSTKSACSESSKLPVLSISARHNQGMETLLEQIHRFEAD